MKSCSRCSCPQNEKIYEHFVKLLLKYDRIASSSAVECKKKSLLRVMRNLKRFPIPINSVEDAKLIDGVGQIYAEEIEKVLLANQESQSSPTSPQGVKRKQGVLNAEVNENQEKGLPELCQSPLKQKLKQSPVFRRRAYETISISDEEGSDEDFSRPTARDHDIASLTRKYVESKDRSISTAAYLEDDFKSSSSLTLSQESNLREVIELLDISTPSPNPEFEDSSKSLQINCRATKEPFGSLEASVFDLTQEDTPVKETRGNSTEIETDHDSTSRPLLSLIERLRMKSQPKPIENDLTIELSEEQETCSDEKVGEKVEKKREFHSPTNPGESKGMRWSVASDIEVSCSQAPTIRTASGSVCQLMAKMEQQDSKDESEERQKLETITNYSDFEIVVFVDLREKDHAFIQANLTSAGILCQVATLSLGDFLFAARRKVTSSNAISKSAVVTAAHSDIVVVECIVERKTIGDLAASIVDGRYNEQKERLSDCGIPFPVYVVEGLSLAVPAHPRSGRHSVNSAAIRTSLTATQILHGIHVIRTRGIDHTANIILALHRQVSRRFFTGKAGSEFPNYFEFQKKWGKRQIETIGQLFAHQLRQIPGCSATATATLKERFPTLADMIRYMKETEQQQVLRELTEMRKSGTAGQRLGPKLAKTLWQIFREHY